MRLFWKRVKSGLVNNQLAGEAEGVAVVLGVGVGAGSRKNCGAG